MPTHCEEDNKTKIGYCQWGYKKGKKYSYKVGSKRSKTVAKNKADRQGRAIKANSFRGGKATRKRKTTKKTTRKTTKKATRKRTRK